MPDRLVARLIERAGLREAATVHLLDGIAVTRGGYRLEVPEGSQRLLALVALHPNAGVDRRWAAGTLWPTGGEYRAAGNLRTALWRLKCTGVDLLSCDKVTLRLRPGTVVDVDLVTAWADQMLDPAVGDVEWSWPGWRMQPLDLLPGWYDDWVLVERERLRLTVLHALDVLAERLLAQGRYVEALQAALAAVRSDSLRESAQSVLVRIHLAEGNIGEARRVYAEFCRLLDEELGVRPSRGFRWLMSEAERQAQALSWSLVHA